MYPSAVCKTSDKSIEHFTTMKKINCVVMVLVRLKQRRFYAPFEVETCYVCKLSG